MKTYSYINTEKGWQRKIDPLEMLLHMGRAMDKIIEEVLKETRAEK